MPDAMPDPGWYPSHNDDDLVPDAQGRRVPNVLGRFRKHKKLNLPKSREQDEHIYDTVIICEERVRGEKDISPPKRVNSQNYKALIAKYPEAWEAFDGRVPECPGISLEKLEISPEHQTAMMFEGIRCVEDLAEAPDFLCEKMGFGTKTLRQRAIDYLKRKENEEPKKRGRPPKVSAENEAMISG